MKPFNLHVPIVCCSLLWVALLPPVVADDIDAYQPAIRSHYLHVLIDPGDADTDQVLCTLGVDCPPSLLSEAAYSSLRARLMPGMDVAASDVFLAVLDSALSHPALSDINIALGISNHHANSDALGRPVGGGTLLQGYRKPAQFRRALGGILRKIPSLRGAAAHAFQPRESFLEWLRYIRGEPVALGINTEGNYGAAQPVPDFDSAIIRGGEYRQGVNPTAICPNVVSLVFSSAPPRFDTDLDDAIEREVGIEAAGAFENLLRALSVEGYNLLPKRSQPVFLGKVWVVGTHKNATMAQVLAEAAGTKALFASDPQAFEKALTERLLGILAPQPVVSTVVFGPRIDSASGTQRDVFLAQAEVASGTAWRGNLKKLRWHRGAVSEEADMPTPPLLAISDALGKPALEPAGKKGSNLRFRALSYWTDAAELTVGDGVHIPVGVDGPVVARGGAGQHIEATVGSSRQVYVESTQRLGLTELNPTASLAAELNPWLNPEGELSQEEVVDLIRWGLGEDTAVAEAIPQDWLLGELLHSTPAVLNYGAILGHSPENPKVRIFFGSGDGLFRGVENTTPSGADSGREAFAFYPLETLPNIRLLRENRLSMLQKIYGVDGPPQLLVRDVNNDGNVVASEGDRALVFFGMRRGGASYYALDVSDPQLPPRLLWKIDPQVGPDFKDIALTFSPPIVVRLEVDGTVVDALAFGGGYNGGWNRGFTERRGKDVAVGQDTGDSDDSDFSVNASGNALYIVDAYSGKLIWKAVRGQTGRKSARHYEHAALLEGIAAPVTPVVDAKGITTRLYVGDTGGGVWRVDLRGKKDPADRSKPAHWFITRFANLGSGTREEGGPAENNRRFFHAVDVVHSVDSAGPFDGVLIASGDQAHPNETSVQNYLFYLKDRHVEDGSITVAGENDVARPEGRLHLEDLFLSEGCAEGEGRIGTKNTQCVQPNSSAGWRLRLSSPGEKGVSAPLVAGGSVLLTTYTPASAAECSFDIGRGRLYAISLISAQPVQGKPGFADLGPGIPQSVQAVDDILFVPGWPLENPDPQSPNEAAVSRFIPSSASQLVDLYWVEVGVDAW